MKRHYFPQASQARGYWQHPTSSGLSAEKLAALAEDHLGLERLEGDPNITNQLWTFLRQAEEKAEQSAVNRAAVILREKIQHMRAGRSGFDLDAPSGRGIATAIQETLSFHEIACNPNTELVVWRWLRERKLSRDVDQATVSEAARLLRLRVEAKLVNPTAIRSMNKSHGRSAR